MTLAAGLRLGPYQILTPIGSGGMGEVYRRLHLLGICAIRRTGDRLAMLGSTARLIPSPRSSSRGASRFARLLRETLSRRECL